MIPEFMLDELGQRENAEDRSDHQPEQETAVYFFPEFLELSVEESLPRGRTHDGIQRADQLLVYTGDKCDSAAGHARYDIGCAHAVALDGYDDILYQTHCAI